MNYFNYSVSSKEGKLYQKSKTPAEGYQEVTYGEGKKTYHKYTKSVTGVAKYFGSKEVNFEGKTLKFLELTLIDGEDSHKISVPLKNSKGGYTDEARLMISSLKGLEKIEEPVTFTVSKNSYTNSRGESKESLSFYINYVNIKNEAGKGLSTGFIPFNDIPAPEKKTVAGDTVYDWSPQTEFYYQEFLKIEDRFKNNSDSSSEPANNTENTSESKADDLEEDDLPF